jgi:2-keto-4-pentenoate hydratase/2-oxohepta-3-ene-1,7-dioic acid hydratase in catechol pathway
MIKNAAINARAVAVVFGMILLLALTALGYTLFRPLAHKPMPARFHCYDLTQGTYVALGPPPKAFGVGLSYASHIEETASTFDPGAAPPIFRKRPRALARTGAIVIMPDTHELCAAADALEPGLGEALHERHDPLSPLLDYEGEMGFVLLDDIEPEQLDAPGFVPRLGFFVVNDLSARTLAIAGEGRPNRYEYWGASKSFAGFMPVADRAWVPNEAKADGVPCIVIETAVNGEVRQSQSTEDMIYTPLQMLRFILVSYPGALLRRGTFVLTGTPGGVAMTTPRWLVRLSKLLGLDRFTMLKAKFAGDTSRFLKPGDRVVVRGGLLGEVSVTIAAGRTL